MGAAGVVHLHVGQLSLDIDFMSHADVLFCAHVSKLK